LPQVQRTLSFLLLLHHDLHVATACPLPAVYKLLLQ
jgi:hypothetical protein